MMRRAALILCVSAFRVTFLSAAEMEDESAVRKNIGLPEARDKALAKAVAFLVSHQKPDGSFGEKYPTAMTGLSVMALMAVGHTPDDEELGPAIRRALNFVLSQMREDGYFGERDGSRMYGHGICTLMLTEAAGMTRDDVLERRLIEACKRGVNVILNAQAIKKSSDQQGGWGATNPTPTKAISR